MGLDEPLFITVPSTSGQNTPPERLAELLRRDLGGEVISGMDVAEAVHLQAMKDVPRESRPFVPREYSVFYIEQIKGETAGKTVVVVEDVFSSGASAKAFRDTLTEAGIQVTITVGLPGDSRLQAEPQLVKKLEKTFRNAGINGVSAKDAARVLARNQITTLIDVINERGKDGCQGIAEALQRVLNSRIARNMGQSIWRNVEKEHGVAIGENNSHERSGARIPAKPGIPLCGGTDIAEKEPGDGQVSDKPPSRDKGMSR